MYVLYFSIQESRKKSEDSGRPKKKSKYLGDLIVFGLPVSVKNEDLKEYFEETCGEMDFAEVSVNFNISFVLIKTPFFSAVLVSYDYMIHPLIPCFMSVISRQARFFL